MGLVFMFLAFAELSKIISSRDPQKKHYAGFALFSILTALSHQLTFFMVSIITLFVVVRGYFKKESRLPGRYLIESLVPSLVIFAAIVILPRFTLFPEVNPFPILYRESLMEQSATNLFVNYIGFISYSELFNRIVYTFIVAFIPLFPLILVGFKGARLPAFLTFLMVLVLVCTFSPLLTGISLFNWDRWMWLLVFPFGMYASVGIYKVIDKLSSLNVGSRWKKMLKALFISAVIFLFASLSFVYITRPQSDPFILYGNFPSMWYLPETMRKTALPFEYIPDVEDCAKWLDGNVLGNSVVLFESPLSGPVLLNLTPRNNVTLVSYYPTEFAKVLQDVAQREFEFIYLLWWTNYAIPTSNTDFTRIYSKGVLSVYVKPERIKPPSFAEKTKLIGFSNETCIEIPDNERLSPPTFTVEFWARPLSFTPWSRWMGKSIYTQNHKEGWQILYSDASANPRVFLAMWSEDNVERKSGSIPIVLGEWVYTAFVFNGSDLISYRNGLLNEVTSVGDWTPLLSREPLLIGKAFYTTYYSGYFATWRFYNRSLSQSEVLGNFMGQTTRNGLISEFEFVDTGASIIPDLSGEGNNGTIITTLPS
jgi:hypothetical protein